MSERLFDDKLFDATWNMIGPDGHCIPWWDIARNEIKDFIDAEIRRNTDKLEADLADNAESLKIVMSDLAGSLARAESAERRIHDQTEILESLEEKDALISEMRAAALEAIAATATEYYDKNALAMVNTILARLSASSEPAPLTKLTEWGEKHLTPEDKAVIDDYLRGDK